MGRWILHSWEIWFNELISHAPSTLGTQRPIPSLMPPHPGLRWPRKPLSSEAKPAALAPCSGVAQHWAAPVLLEVMLYLTFQGLWGLPPGPAPLPAPCPTRPTCQPVASPLPPLLPQTATVQRDGCPVHRPGQGWVLGKVKNRTTGSAREWAPTLGRSHITIFGWRNIVFLF